MQVCTSFPSQVQVFHLCESFCHHRCQKQAEQHDADEPVVEIVLQNVKRGRWVDACVEEV